MWAGKQVGYIRVSSVDQNVSRQLEGVELDKTFTDKASGKDIKRPALQECLDFIRDGDTLHVHSIDRLARNLSDLQKLVKQITDKGVSIIFHKENMPFKSGKSDSMQMLMLQMLGAFAEFERSMIRERQREGIAIAKKQGRKLGRNAAINPKQAIEIQNALAGGNSIAAIAKEYGVSRPTIYKYAKKKSA